MKTKITYPHNTPDAVKVTIDSMVMEWQRHIDIDKPSLVGVIYRGGYYCVCISPTIYTFYLRVDAEGRAYDFTLSTFKFEEMLCGMDNSGVNPSAYTRAVLCIPSPLDVLNGTLSVTDITNLQPHEYGLLKLKCGLGTEEIHLMGGIIREFSKSPNPRFSVNFDK